MPRTDFQQDFKNASTKLPPQISDLKKGDDDGCVLFTYTPSSGELDPIELQAMTEVGDYPKNHTFFVFETSETASESAHNAMAALCKSSQSQRISQFLTRVSQALGTALAAKSASADQEVGFVDDAMFDDEEAESEDYDEEEDEYDDMVAFGEGGNLGRGTASQSRRQNASGPAVSEQFVSRIKSDFCAAKAAGFKVSIIGSLLDGQDGFGIVSCRIKKLEISSEALTAWDLDEAHYLVLLLRYDRQYVHAEQVSEHSDRRLSNSIDFYVGTCSHYKPTQEQCINAFNKGKKSRPIREIDPANDAISSTGITLITFKSLFIGKPLNRLLCERFHTIFRTRMSFGYSWYGAEKYYDSIMGGMFAETRGDEDIDDYEPSQPNSTLATIVLGDHIKERAVKEQVSLPLATMQFVLRHVARCTEFCLVCHSKTNDTFEALKPYVCSKPLCLYQYMALGFGPSIEYEVRSQPQVVNILLTFCYTSALQGRLKDFPAGLGLMIPHPSVLGDVDGMVEQSTIPQRAFTSFQPPPPPATGPNVDGTTGPLTPEELLPPPSIEILFNSVSNEVVFDVTKNPSSPLRPGDWIMLQTATETKDTRYLHTRVVSSATYPTVVVAQPISREFLQQTVVAGQTSFQKPPTTPNVTEKADLYKYEVKFDQLSSFEKRKAICFLLSCLPPVENMQSYLAAKRSNDASFLDWKDVLSPAALGLLRWVIASNRACILEALPTQQIYGISGALQFRFAMGSPDKEARFLHAVRKKDKETFPTIFAWHGSPVANFHSILREGLNFNETVNGRAYGNGCYHSLDYNTSKSYSTISRFGGGVLTKWPANLVKVQYAMCLNEIVNAPSEFVSQTPHLVVHQTDWIQTRYLFVGLDYQTDSGPIARKAPYDYLASQPGLPSPSNSILQLDSSNVYPQDPLFTPRNPYSRSVQIPLAAVAISRRPQQASLCNPLKISDSDSRKVRVVSITQSSKVGSYREVIDLTENDDSESVHTTTSDKELLDLSENVTSAKIVEAKVQPKSSTNWIPGTVDPKSLPILLDPSDASINASKTLQMELKRLLALQKAESPVELGWYIDTNLIESPYQWIVELHSFDESLPLVKDMISKGLRSIIAEVRFTAEHPMSPPFVRIVRPRFVPFMQGGGGHVTAGGAMCMELLTNSGWSPVSSIESVLMQVRMAISSTEPHPARLARGPVSDYATGEAVEAYIRSCQVHGWRVPENFRAFARGELALK
ncbi:MAG: hypothetical protein M1814_005276 [Vezdaea aestivalis]|nr:MAG: hypothetical protein M1814_005276 [Vezdaea aestivalis]